jgi:hypothetical protein
MIALRSLEDRDLRRGRLLAARSRAIGSVTRRGILSGQWDGGQIVRDFMSECNPTTKQGDLT